MTLYMEVGKTMVMTLPSNPTTGYMWEYHVVGDSIVVKRVYVPDNTHLMGGGGYTLFYIHGEKVGISTLTLTYERPWEKKPVDTRVYMVMVD